MTTKEEAERLVRRFTAFLNFDSISDMRCHDPFDADRNERVKKDAKILAGIAIEEILLQAQMIEGDYFGYSCPYNFYKEVQQIIYSL